MMKKNKEEREKKKRKGKEKHEKEEKARKDTSYIGMYGYLFSIFPHCNALRIRCVYL